MRSWFFRYVRLWVRASEARAELLVSRWVGRLLAWIAALFAGGIALLLATVAFILWVGDSLGWAGAFVIGALIWIGLAGIGFWIIPRAVRSSRLVQDALYRMKLAQAGMRLLEKRLSPPESDASPPWLSAAYTFLGRWLSRWILRLVRKWLPLP